MQLHSFGRYFRRGLTMFALAYAGVMLVSFVLDLTLPPTNTSIEAFKTLFELTLWLVFPLLLLMPILRAWRPTLAMLGVVGIFVITFWPYLAPRTPNVLDTGIEIELLTVNTEGEDQGISEIILASDADIVAVQELSQALSDRLSQLDEYPYQALHPQPTPAIGQGILSRYPIENDTYWEYPNIPHTLGNQRAEILIESNRIALYNVHPWPPLGWDTGYNDESHRVVVKDIAARAFDETLPVLLMGDFNMTDNFGEYDLLETRFIDSYRVAGPGIGFTYPNIKFEPVPAIVRLDYIWHDEHFLAIAADKWPEHGSSDHSPVIATLLLATESE